MIFVYLLLCVRARSTTAIHAARTGGAAVVSPLGPMFLFCYCRPVFIMIFHLVNRRCIFCCFSRFCSFRRLEAPAHRRFGVSICARLPKMRCILAQRYRTARSCIKIDQVIPLKTPSTCPVVIHFHTNFPRKKLFKVEKSVRTEQKIFCRKKNVPSFSAVPFFLSLF